MKRADGQGYGARFDQDLPAVVYVILVFSGVLMLMLLSYDFHMRACLTAIAHAQWDHMQCYSMLQLLWLLACDWSQHVANIHVAQHLAAKLRYLAPIDLLGCTSCRSLLGVFEPPRPP